MECSDGENTASHCAMSAGSRLRGRRRLRERQARWPAVIAVAVCALSVLGAVRAASSGSSSHTGAVEVDNLNEKCELPDGRLGYCLHDYQCHPNFTIATGGLLLGTDIRFGDSKRLTECGGFLWCCADDSNATATTIPTAASTPGATDVTAARFTEVDNLNEKCELPDGRLGYCLHDYQCHPNFTIATGGLLLGTDIRIGDSKRLTECGGFLWCCADDSNATATTIPTAASTPGATDVTAARFTEVDNLNEKCELPDGRLGYCLHDYQCHPNFTIATGGLLLGTDIRIGDSKRLTECGGFLWCCADDSNATATTIPTAASTPGATDVTAARFTEVDNLNEKCELPDGRLGYCLHDYQCHPNFTIATGGLLLGTDIRIGDSKRLTECGGFLWCCADDSNATATTIPTAASTPGATDVTTAGFTGINECQRGFQNCPWCVALYRRDGDVRRSQVSESGLYCAGALLGTRVVLTSGTCVRTVVRAPVWARVYAARDPGHHYHVVDRLVHHNYNSGSHANDFGLFLLEEDVVWESSAGGACLQNSLRGNCFVPSFDDFQTPVLTALTVRDGDCPPRRRNISDMACGIIADATSGGDCAILPGAPVLCPVTDDGQSGQAVAGVVRRVCVGGATDRLLLGQLWRHADWLRVHLAQFGVRDAQYTPRT